MAISSTRPASRGDRMSVVLRRWPLALGLAAGALVWGVDTATAGQLMLVLPLVYVAVLTVGHRSASWPLLVLAFGYCIVLELQSSVGLGVGLGVAGIAVAAVGFVLAARRGHVARSEMLVQAAGLALWLVVAVVVTAVAPDLARLLVATAWLAHGLWDLWHLRRDAVVARSYAEWCAMFDTVLGVGLLVAW